MQAYEYKVIPAPRRGEKVRGARTVPERFAVALTQVMNEQAREGWDYLRADTLPCDERVGLTGTATHFQNMLVFRRALTQPVPAQVPHVAPLPEPEPDATLIAPLPFRAVDRASPTIDPAKSPFTLVPPNGRL